MKLFAAFLAFILVVAAGIVRAAEDDRPIVDGSKVPVEKVADSALPTFHIVGDSTVRANGMDGKVGWGERITPFFNTQKINVVDHAIAGRSARTFFTEGRWKTVADALKSGDFVIIQFGHNDQGQIGDPANKGRADGKGIGDETVQDTLPGSNNELVHTFGWYMAQFVTSAKAKGATVILVSPIPHKQHWENERDFLNIASWDSQVAKAHGALYFDLTMIVTDVYKKLAHDKVEGLFADKGTHTTDAGAQINAAAVIAGLKSLEGQPLANYFSAQGNTVAPYQSSSKTAVTNTSTTKP